MQTAKLSVVMPAYNSSSFIMQSIQSILSQTYRNFELIIVDDGSNDDTYDLIAGVEDNRVKCFKKNNGGAASARNYAINHSSGAYIAYCDHDDRYRPEHLSMLVDYLEKNQQVGMVYSKSVRIYLDGKREVFGHDFDKQILEYSYYIVPSIIVHRRDCLSKVGEWDESLGRFSHDDMEFFLRFSDNFIVHHLPVVSVERSVLRPQGGYYSSLANQKYFVGMKLFLEKRAKTFEANKRNGKIAPFDGYYFHFFLSQCASVISYGKTKQLFHADDIMRLYILPAFQEFLEKDSSNIEIYLLVTLLYLTIHENTKAINVSLRMEKYLNQKLDFLEGTVKDLIILTLNKIDPVLANAGYKELALKCLEKSNEMSSE